MARVTPRRKSKRKIDPTLSAYVSELSRRKLLSRERERELALELRERREQLWRSLLSHPPFVAGVIEILECVLSIDEAQSLRSEFEGARALASMRPRHHDDACEELALAMAELDLDARRADAVIARLEALSHARDDGWPQPDVAFTHWLERVHDARRALRETKNAFVEANLRLVVAVARRYDYGTMALSDRVQEGNLGLIKAVDRFDVRRGYRFSTYATWWIRHYITRAQANKGRVVRLPAHVFNALTRIRRTVRALESRSGEAPTTLDLVRATGLSRARVRQLEQLSLDNPTSLDTPVDDGRSLVERLCDEDAPEPTDVLELDAMVHQLEELLDELDPIELDIIRRRYGLASETETDDTPMTLRELGYRHSLSRERIRQLQERALSKLRREFARRDRVPSELPRHELAQMSA